jgi:glutamine synthetase
MAWGNRDATKSFLRLSEGHETPTKFQWDFFNRKALVRLPIQSRTAQGDIRTPATVEFRLGDGSAHPHLLLAGIAQAFCHAYLMDDTTLMEVVDHCRVHLGKSHDPLEAVPRNQNDIAAILGAHSQIYAAGNVFHPSFIEKFLANLLNYHGDEKEEKEEEKDPSSVGEELSNIMIQEPKQVIHHHHHHKQSTKSK